MKRLVVSRRRFPPWPLVFARAIQGNPRFMTLLFSVHILRVLLAVGISVSEMASLARALDPFEQEISQDLDRIARQIADAESQTAEPITGGAIMAIAHRLSVLRQTKALLERHRLTARDRTLRSTAQIEAEINANKIKESAARSKFYAARGGFVKVVDRLTLVTIQDDIAVLELRRVQAKYGLTLSP